MPDGLTTHIARLGLLKRVSKVDAVNDTLHWIDAFGLIEVRYQIATREVVILFTGVSSDGQRKQYAPRDLGHCGRFFLPHNISMFEVFKRCITFLRLAERVFDGTVEQINAQRNAQRRARRRKQGNSQELQRLISRLISKLLSHKNAVRKALKPTPFQLQLRQQLTELKALDKIPMHKQWWSTPMKTKEELMQMPEAKFLAFAKYHLWTTNNALERAADETQQLLREVIDARCLRSSITRKRIWWKDEKRFAQEQQRDILSFLILNSKVVQTHPPAAAPTIPEIAYPERFPNAAAGDFTTD